MKHKLIVYDNNRPRRWKPRGPTRTATPRSRRELQIDAGRFVVFIPRWNAFACAQFLEAVHMADSWHELQTMLSVAGYKWVTDHQQHSESSAEAFRPRFLDDGDFPYFPPERMVEWMPKEIFNRFATFEDSFFNGVISELPSEATDEIVSALQVHGFICIRSDNLVQAASAYTE